jgi:hypothetical protein
MNTDKYEGHTQGPWVCTHSPVNGGKQFWSVVDHTQPTDVGDDTLGNWRIADIIDFEADAQLIADAPLILEAYKRLVIVADELYLHVVGEPHMTLDELVAEMPWRNEDGSWKVEQEVNE